MAANSLEASNQRRLHSRVSVGLTGFATVPSVSGVFLERPIIYHRIYLALQ